ncbi:hypothetical protein ACFFGH_00560 [Lysobacter korlensis]|uniref:WxL domain-containing protein n=1 Tax=Lysobacter korlensis TaxID=553636 RepID=A0ABV6RH75_9GAMM
MRCVSDCTDAWHKRLWNTWHASCDRRRVLANRPSHRIALENDVNLFKASLLAAAVLATAPLAARAESDFVNGSGDASARLDFRVTIPRVLFLRVGTGADATDNTNVNLIEFAPGAATLGDGTAVAGSGGDLGGGAVTAKVIGNNGTITLKATTTGALSNGSGDSIPFSQIITTPTALSSATPLAAPQLANGESSITITPDSGKVVKQDARWTFSYANTVTPAPGTYGGVNTNNGRVTYTASMP